VKEREGSNKMHCCTISTENIEGNMKIKIEKKASKMYEQYCLFAIQHIEARVAR
jgi:hypothetical protein